MFDLLVIFGYLLATVWIGLRAGIGMKSIEEFAVAGAVIQA
jgi:Na+/proline symporter